MHVSIVGLRAHDLSIQYIRTEEVSVKRDLVLYDDYEFVVPVHLDPRMVKGVRVQESESAPEKIMIVMDDEMKYAWDEMRRKRAQLLAESDWTQFADVKLDADKKDAWATYRQALRDLPNQTPDPTNVVWPSPPQ